VIPPSTLHGCPPHGSAQGLKHKQRHRGVRGNANPVGHKALEEPLGALVLHNAHHTVCNSAVHTVGGALIHEAALHHIHWAGGDGCDEASTEGAHQMQQNALLHGASVQNAVLDVVIGGDLGSGEDAGAHCVRVPALEQPCPPAFLAEYVDEGPACTWVSCTLDVCLDADLDQVNGCSDKLQKGQIHPCGLKACDKAAGDSQLRPIP